MFVLFLLLLAVAGGPPSKGTPADKRLKANSGDTKKTGKFHGKSNALGHGGRAAQLRAKGVPEGVIGMIARRKHAAPGMKNFHGGK